jgi:HAE1 family hydrophobic/amphiphilic exporter-1
MNWIIQLFVKRPVFSSMVYVGIAMFGIIGWVLMPRELFPNVALPQLNVITKYANAAPEEIENLITKPIEEAVGTVPNLKRVRSTSKEGLSVVTLEFNSGADMGIAHLSVREKLDRIKANLPPESDEPIVKRVNPFSHALMILSITGRRSLMEMTEIAKQVIKQRLEKVDGVASATLSGGQEKQIQVELDRGTVEAERLSLNQVVQSLKDTNFNYPAGTTQGQFYEYLVRTIGEYEHVSDIGQTVVQVENPRKEEGPLPGYDPADRNRGKPTPHNQRIVLLNTIGTIQEGVKEKKSEARYNGQENVSISIQKQAEVNTVDVAERAREAIDELRLSLPKDIHIDVVYDESEYVLESLAGMRNEALTGGLLALFVLFFFFGSFRDAFNVGLSIPLSLLGVFIMIYFGKMSLNFMTLAAISMSIGKFSDDAIVVAENVVRHQKVLGKPPKEAAIDGASDVAASMVSSTLTNIAVLLPLWFVEGVAQQLFRDLFIVTAFASFASMVVSLTIIPRLAAYPISLPKFFHPGGEPHRGSPGFFGNFWRVFVTGLTEESLQKYLGFYERSLVWVVSHRKFVVQVLVGLLAGSAFLIMRQEKVFMPKMDQGQFIVQVNMPVGARLEVTDRVASRVEQVLMGIRGVKSVSVSVGSSDNEEEVTALGPHQAQCVVVVDREARRNSEEILAEFKSLIPDSSLEGGELISILQDSPLRAALAGGAPIEIEIKGPELETLRKFSDEIVRKVSQVRGAQSVKSSFPLASRETRVKVDRDRAAAYGMNVAEIAKNALIAIKGSVPTKFKEAGKEVEILVRLRPQDRATLDDIRRVALYSSEGAAIPLEEVASIQEGAGAGEIMHLDQQRAVVVSAEVFQRGVGEVIGDVQKILNDYKNVANYTFTLAGESQRIQESFGGMEMTSLLAIALVYMIMAAQFESLWQPFVIMFTVPFSFIGVAMTLWVTHTPVSAVVMLSMVMLGGIVVNNGIVLIDHVNVLKSGGLSTREAALHGARDRARPILMTMLTAVLGVLPMALGLSRGSELAQPMAMVTFGGLFVSTCLTLVVIPLLYIWVDERGAAQPEKVKEFPGRDIPALEAAPKEITG